MGINWNLALEFVQDVLVPETACLLVMEDMNIDAKEAREVMVYTKLQGKLNV